MADGGGGGGEGPPIFFLDSAPINSQEWKKKKAKRGFFLHVADKKRFTSREKAELAGRVLQRAQTQAASIGIATTT